MNEEGLSLNSDWTLVLKLSNDLIKLQTNFNNFVIEEKEKTDNLEKKNCLLENELKEMNKKIEKINFDYKNEIEEMKQNLKLKDEKINFLKEENKRITADNENKIEEIKQNIKQLCSESNDYLKQNGDNIKFLEEEFNKKIQKINCDIENKIGETNQNSKKLIEENINQLKAENASKDEKINSVKEEIKNVNELLEKKIGNLAIELNNIYCKCVNFVKINNKWSEIDSLKTCCDNNCINTYKPIGSCIKGNGFGNLIDDENIKYLVKNGGCNNDIRVYAENSFKKPKNCLDYSLYYFEIKCKIEGELVNNVGKYISIGIKNCNTNEMITFSATLAKIYNEKDEKFEINNVFLNNNDIFGCGLVYPPSNKLNEKFPYVFFTQNGKQIGKGILLKDNSDLFKPRVWLKSCSVDANFGNDLQTNPFTYDISKHSILKEFY